MNSQHPEYLYPTQTKSWLYTLLYPWVSKGVDLFVDQLEVVGLENIPQEGPLMLIANHQNAMFDPLICCRVFPKQLHWLTRSDVFKNKMVASFLYKIHMLPIYREKDQVADQMERNEAVFKVCRERLSKGAVVAMFPEGSHRGKKQLMTPLKKGFARLAFSSIEKDARLMNLRIIPMALDYSTFTEYQPRILLKLGAPIVLKDYWELYTTDSNKAVSQLVKDAAEQLSGLMIDIRDDEHYASIMDLAPLFCNDNGEPSAVGYAQFQQFVKSWDTLEESKRQFYLRYHALLKEMKISASCVERGHMKKKWKVQLNFVVEWFPALLGRICFSPLYGFTEWFIKKKVKDELFYNSIRLAFYTFLMPFYALLLLVVAKLILPNLSGLEILMGGMFVIAIGLFVINWNKINRVNMDITAARYAQRKYPELWREAMGLRNQIKSNG